MSAVKEQEPKEEILEKARNLVVGIMTTALKDFLSDPTFESPAKSRDAYAGYQFFWSRSFKDWCQIVEWDANDYKFITLRTMLRRIHEGEDAREVFPPGAQGLFREKRKGEGASTEPPPSKKRRITGIGMRRLLAIPKGSTITGEGAKLVKGFIKTTQLQGGKKHETRKVHARG